MVEFNSYNTQRLTVEEVKQKLLALEYVKNRAPTQPQIPKGATENNNVYMKEKKK